MNNENLQTDLSLTAEIKLYYDLSLPENANKPLPLLIAVHGYGGNKRAMMREARAIVPENFAIASLQGFHQHWRESESRKDNFPKVGFAWLTNYRSEESVAVHHKALQDLIDNLINNRIADAHNVFLLGFSQACALNFRFAFTRPNIFRGVVGISGGIPGDWETNVIYSETEAAIFYLYGDNDEFYPLEKFEENAAKLKIRSTHFESKKYAAKHEITNEMQSDVKSWLISNLHN